MPSAAAPFSPLFSLCGPSAFTGPRQVGAKPILGQCCNGLECSWFLEKVCSPGHDLQFLCSGNELKCISIEFDDLRVIAPNNEQGRHDYFMQRGTGQVGPPAPRHDSGDQIAFVGCGDQGCG